MKTDRITEIAVIVHNGHRIIEEFSTLINPLKPIQPFVSALTGISNEMVADAPTFNEVIDRVEDLTANRILVAHNARFDYTFLKNEYRRNGRTFRRKLLCTVNTSKKVFPNRRSYGLGNICQDLDIEIHDRHRAHGDATATTILLEKLLFNDKKRIIKQMLKGELATANLPAAISPELVDELPEETGVYYFHDDKGRVIYVGKSKSIRDRVISHFRNDAANGETLKMRDKVRDITYDLTGDELVALIRESHEIKRWMPEFNRAQRRRKYRYGLMLDTDQSGFYRFRIDLLHPDRQPIHKFHTKKRAENFLHHLYRKNKIDPDRKPNSSPKHYNKKVESAISRYRYPAENFLLIGHGRTLDENSVIQVEKRRYMGYGYFDPVITGSEAEAIRASITPYPNHPDIKGIILSYLRKYRKRATLVRY